MGNAKEKVPYLTKQGRDSIGHTMSQVQNFKNIQMNWLTDSLQIPEEQEVECT